MSLRDTEKVKQLQLKGVEHCELPKEGVSQQMLAKKKAQEIRYSSSPSRLSFMVSALLSNQSRIVKQGLLEIDDIQKRVFTVLQLITQEIEVRLLVAVISERTTRKATPKGP